MVVEGAHNRIQLLLQCANPFTESVKLLAGSMLGCFQEDHVGPSLGDMTEDH